MNQPALTKRIVDSLGLKDQRLHDIPAEPNVRLTKDEDGPERKDKFHYRSLIGQLNYLTASARPEIQFATHQLARFSENPKMSHQHLTAETCTRKTSLQMTSIIASHGQMGGRSS